MEHWERAEAFWERLLEEAAKVGLRWAELSEKLKRHRSYLSTVRRRSNEPTLDDAFGVLAALPEPEWCVFGRLFPPPAGPGLLRSLGERAAPEGGGDPRQALPGLGEAWRRLLELPVDAAAEPGPSFRSKLAWLEESPGEPAEAARRLEPICVELQVAAASRKAAHPQALGELGVALALWAAGAAAGPGVAVALEAQALGLELAERSHDPWCLGVCHWRSGLLLRELGLAQVALGFLQAAGFHFGMSGDSRGAARLLGSTAEVLLELRRPGEAAALLERQLRWLPPGAHRHRFQALARLAELAQAGGRAGEALALVEAAELQGCREGEALARLAARKAALLFEMGEPARAAKALGAALEGLAAQGLTAEMVWALAETQEYAQRTGQGAAVKLVAAEAAAALPKLKAGRLRCRIEDFVAAGRLPAGIPPGFFNREKERLERAGARVASPFGPGGVEAALARRGARPAETKPKRRGRARREGPENAKTSAISDESAFPRAAAAAR